MFHFLTLIPLCLLCSLIVTSRMTTEPVTAMLWTDDTDKAVLEPAAASTMCDVRMTPTEIEAAMVHG